MLATSVRKLEIKMVDGTYQRDRQTVEYHGKHHYLVYVAAAGQFSPPDVSRSKEERNAYSCVHLHLSVERMRDKNAPHKRLLKVNPGKNTVTNLTCGILCAV